MPDHLGIYVHWPFCQAKCPYCDFNSHVVSHVDHSRWRAAYTAEIARAASLTPDRTVGSIFFGGGTPSMMEPETVETVIDGIRRNWRTANDLEITLEANPTSVEAERFRGYASAGVNRVSMGIQALNDPDLKRLGRLHSVEEAQTAFATARATFDRVSFDLIYARQDQSLAAWRDELREALDMAADHLSLYQLTIEDGTAFGDRFRRGGLRGLPDEDLTADMYEVTQELTREAGLPAYEISNHARPGAESRHNMIYWTGGDYVGIGPGAHGRIAVGGRRHTTEAVSAPLVWLNRVMAGQTPDQSEALTEHDIFVERLMMGLRIDQGVHLADLRPTAAFQAEVQNLGELGLVTCDDGYLRTTPAGRPLLNSILRALLT